MGNFTKAGQPQGRRQLPPSLGLSLWTGALNHFLGHGDFGCLVKPVDPFLE